MIILILIIVLVSLYELKVTTYNDEYASKPATDSIKGIFTIIILYSHLKSYLPPYMQILHYQIVYSI